MSTSTQNHDHEGGLTVSKDPRFKLDFDNQTINSLPIDSIKENYVRSVSGACFSRVNPTPVQNPKVIVVSPSALKLIDIVINSQDEAVNDEELAAIFSGSKLLPGSEPSAHCYCGHQFGSFAGQLGDGAAIYLGEVINKDGQRWELQLKGAGPTPYSRSADGRKVLRSSLREFLASEFMAAVNIPTTRAGSCVTSSDTVIRDIFYDGNPIHEKCTIVSRIAPTFIRFGSFEIFKTIDSLTGRRGPSVGRDDIKKKLIHFVIKNYYPEVHSKNLPEKEEIIEFYRNVVIRTAKLVASWQCIGFCHGVLNTDNMSIVGLTIDYGPYGFMDRFDPDHICNASDENGRYSYSKQPVICKWNLMKLAEVLAPEVELDTLMNVLEETYDSVFQESFEATMRSKIGLIRDLQSNEDFYGQEILSDQNMVQLLFDTMAQTGSDFTNTFRCFNDTDLPGTSDGGIDQIFEGKMEKLTKQLIANSSTLNELIKVNESIIQSRDFQIFLMLMQQQPRMLEQIGLSRTSIQRMVSKLEESEKLKTMTNEAKIEGDTILWKIFVEKYSKRLKFDAQKSISGENSDELNRKRKKLMDESNPVLTLRNHLLQKVIKEAEEGNFKPTHLLFERIVHPFKVIDILDTKVDGAPSSASSSKDDHEVGPIESLVKSFYEKTPEEAACIKVT